MSEQEYVCEQQIYECAQPLKPVCARTRVQVRGNTPIPQRSFSLASKQKTKKFQTLKSLISSRGENITAVVMIVGKQNLLF